MRLTEMNVSTKTDKVICEFLYSGEKHLTKYSEKRGINIVEPEKEVKLRFKLLKHKWRNSPEEFTDYCTAQYGLDPRSLKENNGLSPTRVTSTRLTRLPASWHSYTNALKTEGSMMDTTDDSDIPPFTMNLFNAADEATKQTKLLEEENEKLAQESNPREEQENEFAMNLFHATNAVARHVELLKKEQNEKLTRNLNRVKEENEELEARLHTTQQALEEVEVARASLQALFPEMNGKIAQLNSNLRQAQQDLLNTLQDRDDIRARLYTTQQALEETEIARSSMQAQFTELNVQNVQLTSNLHQAQQDLRIARKQSRDGVQELKARLHSMQQAWKGAEVARSSLQGQVNEMKDKNAQLNNNLYQAQQDLRNAREDRDEAREALQDLRVQLNNERAHFQNEKDKWSALIKEERIKAEKEKAELKQSARALKGHIAYIAAVVKKEPLM